MRRITIYLTDEELDALREMAEAQHRNTREQAAMLVRLGLLPIPHYSSGCNGNHHVFYWASSSTTGGEPKPSQSCQCGMYRWDDYKEKYFNQ